MLVRISTSLIVLIAVALSRTAVNGRELVKRFPTCAALNDYYINRVLPLVGPYGLTSNNAYTYTRSPQKVPTDPEAPGGPAGLRLRKRFRTPKRVAYGNLTASDEEKAEELEADGPIAGVDFSTTNVQVRGVDEPDIIKTDGRRVFTISGSVFSVIRVQEDGRKGKRVGSIRLPTEPKEMLIEGDYVMVIGTNYNYYRSAYLRYDLDPTFGEEVTVVFQVKVTGDKPVLVSTLQLEGSYVKSRETDGVARLIIRFDPLSPIWLYYPSGNITTEQTQKWNQEIVESSQAGHWLPTYRLKRGDRVQAGVYATCSDVYYSGTTFSGFDFLTVVTLRLSGDLQPQSAASIVSDTDKIYSTKKTMYVTTSEFRFSDVNAGDARWGAKYETTIHKFDLSDSGATYVGSGAITGSVINQFALHEFRGVLFIATTDGATWWSGRDLSASKVTAFLPNKAGKLVKIGQVGNLGVGERIFAVRYRRETAYVVTFRQIDPLYIIDLSQPRNLRVVGELKIPGFSSYLHRVGPGRILGVGQEATTSGVPTGAKVTLFDVSDKTKPKELSSWSLKGSYSDAEWDHRAFLYWWRQRIAVMPVNVFSGSSQSFRGAIVLKVSEDTITELGRVTHKLKGFTPSILRNAILGGKFLWSMSKQLLQVNDVRKLKEVQSQVKITGTG